MMKNRVDISTLEIWILSLHLVIQVVSPKKDFRYNFSYLTIRDLQLKGDTMDMASHIKSFLSPLNATSSSILPSVTAFRSIIKRQYNGCSTTWCFKTWPIGGDIPYTLTTVQACYLPAPQATISCSSGGNPHYPTSDQQGSPYAAKPTSMPGSGSSTRTSSSSNPNSTAPAVIVYIILGLLVIGFIAVIALLLKKKPASAAGNPDPKHQPAVGANNGAQAAQVGGDQQ